MSQFTISHHRLSALGPVTTGTTDSYTPATTPTSGPSTTSASVSCGVGTSAVSGAVATTSGSVVATSSVKKNKMAGATVLCCVVCGANRSAEFNGNHLRNCPCNTVAYCSKKCQKKHWKEHKRVCSWKVAKKKTRKVCALNVAKTRKCALPNNGQHTTWKECCGMFGLDAHLWHEIDGRVYGLAEMLGMPEIPDGDVPHPSYPIRSPFHLSLSEKVKEFARNQWNRAVEGKTREYIDSAVNISRRNQCTIRANYLMFKWPHIFNETTLRAGSLGRLREDGTMFWEFG